MSEIKVESPTGQYVRFEDVAPLIEAGREVLWITKAVLCHDCNHRDGYRFECRKTCKSWEAVKKLQSALGKDGVK